MNKLKPGEWNPAQVEAGGAGRRLDAFLPLQFPELSRSRAQKLITEGQVKCNGAPARANQLLEAGDRLELFWPKVKPSELTAEEIPLQIYFQDEHLAVIEKPAGLVVHPAAGHESGTLVNALLHHFPDLARGTGVGGEQRPGIVHRIDRNTSGILLITKTDLAHRALGAQFKEHSISRRYLGLAWGKLPSKGEWKGNIGRDPKDRKRMNIVAEGAGRTALTRYRALKHLPGTTHFEAELLTGRTHQIRVHFAAHGFPLVGDATYAALNRQAKQQGEKNQQSLSRRCPTAFEKTKALLAGSRQFLHAAHLGFTHPVTGARMEFDSPLPEDLATLLQELATCAE